MTRYAHGTLTAYCHDLCRCEPCRQAYRDWCARRVETATPEDHDAHLYRCGCRCEVCKAAHRVYRDSYEEATWEDIEADRPMPYPHGTTTAYVKGKCRCAECREAMLAPDRLRVEQHRRDREAGLPLPDGVEHGTYAYTRYCCRCDECREANTKYQREYKARKAAGIVNPLDAENRVERVRLTNETATDL